MNKYIYQLDDIISFKKNNVTEQDPLFLVYINRKMFSRVGWFLKKKTPVKKHAFIKFVVPNISRIKQISMIFAEFGYDFVQDASIH